MSRPIVVAEVGRNWRADAVCVFVLAAAVASLFPGVVVDGGVFFVQDMMVQNVPFRHFLHEALGQWRLPLWEPRINAGFPLFAEGQVGALYPPNWFGAALLSPAQAVTWSVLLHLWLAAAGMFLFLRVLGTGRAAGITAGLSFGLSGYLLVRAMSPNFVAATAAIPWVFLVLEIGLRRRQPAMVGAAGPIIALQWLAGHPQVAVYGALAAGAYGAVRAAQWQAWRAAGFGAVVAATGAAIAAVQILPTMELASLSLRAGGIGYDQFVNMSLPPERLLSLLLPDLFGNSASGSYWGGAEGFFIQLCPYVGVLTLLLAFVGSRDSSSSVRGFFVLLAILGLGLSLGRYSGLFEVLHAIPGLRQFRIPTRFLLWWSFAASVLCGLGADRLIRDPRPLSAGWRIVAVLMVVGVGGAAGFVWQQADQSLATSANVVLARWATGLSTDVWRALLVLVAGAIMCSARWRRRPAAALLTAVACVVVTWADLRSFAVDFNGTVPDAVYARMPASAEAIHTDSAQDDEMSEAVPAWGRFRVAGLISERNAPYDWHSGWALQTTAYERYPATLRMYSAGLYGLANTMPGWSPLHLLAHWEFSRGYPAWLAMANTRYLVTYGAVAPGLAEQIFPDTDAAADTDTDSVPETAASGVTVSRLRNSLPRAWVVPDAVVLADGPARLRHMRSPDFDARQSVVLDRAPARPPPMGTAFAEARLMQYGAEQVLVSLPQTDGYLVLADTYAPGWEALVDGAPREILRANHVFRALPVQAHERRVQFDYKPSALVMGAWISALAAISWLGLTMLAARRWQPAQEGRAARPVPFLLPLALQVALVIGLYGLATETRLWQAGVERLRPQMQGVHR